MQVRCHLGGFLKAENGARFAEFGPAAGKGMPGKGSMIEQQQDTERVRVVKIGPDRVTVKDQEVIIEAKHKMPEWQVRDLNPPPVYFEEKKYQLIHATKGEAPYEARYILKPWPEGQSSSSKLFYS